MAEARVTLDFLAEMLDLPDGAQITHVESVMEGLLTYAQIRFDHEDFGPLDRVQLVYAEDDSGLPALLSIESVSEAQAPSVDG